MKKVPEIKGIPLSPIHERCIGCKRTITFDGFDDIYCSVYAKPSVLWKRGECPAATHTENVIKADKDKVRIGQQKQKKGKK